jgi:predicted Zn-dependent protease
MKRPIFIGLLSLLFVIPFSCKDDEGNPQSVNIFTIEDDKELGRQVAAEIESDPNMFPILDSSQYPEAYDHLRRITNTLLNSGEVEYRDEFVWQTKIIANDTVLNAFCTPGGYIYVYTGLIKFLETEDAFAGVMGHEIAHADERHSTEAMTKAYGLDVLFSIVLGENSEGTVAQIAQGLLNLKYSRNNESEADKRSVDYLYPTEYDARGASRFFEQISAQGGGSGPEFLSTHPNPDNRVEAIQTYWQEKGGKTGNQFEDRYKEFKQSLP